MNWEWLFIRGTGVAAFALLSVSTVWGLLLSTKVLGRAVRAKGLTYFHESLGVGALALTIAHLIGVYRDNFIGFDWTEILLPGMAEWRPFAIAYGVMAFYGIVAVTFSFYLKGRIGQRRWRTLHLMSFGVFVAALLHGTLAGSDTTATPVAMLYVGAAVSVAVLLAIRIAGTANRTSTDPRAAGLRDERSEASLVAGE